MPADAAVAGAAGQRPTGLPTSVTLDPDGPKGHYAFNFPFSPTMATRTHSSSSATRFLQWRQIHLPPQVSLPTQSVGVLLPKSMTFTAGSGSVFQSVRKIPTCRPMLPGTWSPAKALEFTISAPVRCRAKRRARRSRAKPGLRKPERRQPAGRRYRCSYQYSRPLTKYKWWILGALALLLAAAAAFLLRKPVGAPVAGPAFDASAAPVPAFSSPAAKNTALLSALKEELFALESEKLSARSSRRNTPRPRQRLKRY